MKDHVISRPSSTLQIPNPRLPILVTELIENKPRNVDMHRIKAGSPQSDRFRLHVEYLNSAGVPFGDTMKATIEPRSPSLDTVRTTQVHRYRKSIFSASLRTIICRCYSSIDREVESLGACPSVQRSCRFQCEIDRRWRWGRHQM